MNGLIEEQFYRKIREVMPIPTVDALVVYEDRLLLMKRCNAPMRGAWWVPGGRVLRGESLEDAVLRKVYEETGLKGEVVRKVGVINQIFPEVHTITTFFLVYVDSDVVEMNDEHSAYQWVSELHEKSHPYIRRMIEESGVFEKKSSHINK